MRAARTSSIEADTAAYVAPGVSVVPEPWSSGNVRWVSGSSSAQHDLAVRYSLCWVTFAMQARSRGGPRTRSHGIHEIAREPLGTLIL
jgi:hypothetical protein